MTVRELIEELENFNDDTCVFFLLEQHRCNLQYEVYAVEEVDTDRHSGVYITGFHEEYGPRID